jgi:DNA polymerase II large subunit
MTVHRGGIEKYIESAESIVETYNLGEYYSDRITLVREELDSIFGEAAPEEEQTQFNLTDFMRPKEKR